MIETALISGWILPGGWWSALLLGVATTVASRLLSIDDAAAYLSCSPDTVRRLIDAGQISVVRLPATRQRKGSKGTDGSNRRALVDRVELDALIPSWREKRQESL